VSELTITIPGRLAPELSPNHRAHTHWPRTRAIADARSAAAWQTVAVIDPNSRQTARIPERLTYDIEYGKPKGGKQRDDDNLIACTKPHRDGICSALGMTDDRGWTLGTVIQVRDPEGVGYLTIRLTWEAA